MTAKFIFMIIFTTLLATLLTEKKAQAQSEQNINLTCEEARFVRYLNLYRKSRGLKKVEVSESGVFSARWHAQDMIRKNYFSHTEPTGRAFNARADSFGYPAHAENIAAGNADALKTFCQWKLSPGHDKNMLSPRHVTIGIGVISGPVAFKHFWNNNFGPAVSDLLHEPYVGSSCSMPVALPVCKKRIAAVSATHYMK